MKNILITLLTVLLISSCSHGDKPNVSVSDTKQVYSPAAQDDEDKLFNDDEYSAAAYSHRSTFSIALTNSKRTGGTCRPSVKGTAFGGKKFLVVYSNGYKVIVSDPNKRCALSNGFIYRRGGGSYRNAQTWTSHGGAFFASPRGNKSRTLTVYW